MLRQIFVPIHSDGWKFIAIATVASIVLFVIWQPLGWFGVIATLWVAYFFRDPWRVTPTRPGLLISPADGVVVSIAAAAPPSEIGLGDAEVAKIGIFLN